MAVDVIVDAKTDYPAACNAVETVLLHENIADRLLPLLLPALSAKNVEVRLEQSLYDRYARAAGAIAENANIKLATDADFDTEFIDLILAIRSVPSLNAAITHINTHGSRHTDAILAADPVSARHFQRTVDAAGVYWNASTRFADGHRYGFGAEIGVSTSKTHARGPVGLEGLMIYKYKMVGGGHCAEWFGSGDEGKRRFLHEEIAEGERWAL